MLTLFVLLHCVELLGKELYILVLLIMVLSVIVIHFQHHELVVTGFANFTFVDEVVTDVHLKGRSSCSVLMLLTTSERLRFVHAFLTRSSATKITVLLLMLGFKLLCTACTLKRLNLLSNRSLQFENIVTQIEVYRILSNFNFILVFPELPWHHLHYVLIILEYLWQDLLTIHSGKHLLVWGVQRCKILDRRPWVGPLYLSLWDSFGHLW